MTTAVARPRSHMQPMKTRFLHSHGPTVSSTCQKKRVKILLLFTSARVRQKAHARAEVQIHIYAHEYSVMTGRAGRGEHTYIHT